MQGRFRIAGRHQLLDKGVPGGAGIVYKARQRRLNRLVAVKTIGVGRPPAVRHK
jgi:hypothetical protein